VRARSAARASPRLFGIASSGCLLPSCLRRGTTRLPPPESLRLCSCTPSAAHPVPVCLLGAPPTGGTHFESNAKPTRRRRRHAGDRWGIQPMYTALSPQFGSDPTGESLQFVRLASQLATSAACGPGDSGRSGGAGGKEGLRGAPPVPRVYLFLAFPPPRGAPFHQSEKTRRFPQKTGLSRKHRFKNENRGAGRRFCVPCV
jgi:hypothetical protein